MDSTTKDFINTINYNNYSNGNGDDNSDGYGYGYDYDISNGDGNGYGYGYSYGNGYNNVYGDGIGFGYGNGKGNGFGFGYGNDAGYGIKQINNISIIEIDGIPTAIKHVKGNVAKGYIFKNFQLIPCYVVNQDNYFAHGKTVRDAVRALKDKISLNTSIEERINAFLSEIKIDKEYKARVFYEWHHRLTGSCEFGRNEFIERYNISLDEMMTVKRFIELTENDYAGEVIRQLKERIM